LRPVRACVTPFSLPLVRSVQTGHGTLFNRAGILLEIEDSRSLKGYGEATPIPGFGTESLEEACDALARFLPVFLREKQWSIEETLENFRIAFPAANTALSAIDTALCDLSSKQQDCSVAALLAGKFQTEVSGTVMVNGLLQSQILKELVEEAEQRWSEGFRTFKIKVGVQSIAQDIERIGAVRKTLGEDAKIRLDVNEAWTPEEAERALPALSTLSIEYLEQPLPAHNLQGAAALRKKSTIFLAADEAACSPGDIKTVLNRQAADIIVLKPAATGGPHLSMQMGWVALGFNVPCVTTTLMDGAVGRAMATHVAAALPASGEPYACGLATGELLAQDLADGLKTRDGRIAVDQVKGLGVVVCQDQLARVASGKTMEFSA
jgi:o-succinylbenzoate synthase